MIKWQLYWIIIKVQKLEYDEHSAPTTFNYASNISSLEAFILEAAI